MSTVTVAATEVELNDEGFFVHPEQWTEEMAPELARREGIEPLTDAHWTVIRFVRNEYREKGTGPTVRPYVLTEDDVRFALSRQFNNVYLPAGDTSLNNHLVAAYKPFSPTVEKLRGLRSQLMLRWFDADAEQNILAIVSPGAGEGRSFIAANLAIVFSQLGKRTLLVDSDLRAPRQHELFKLGNNAGLSSLLAGRAGAGGIARIPSLPGLSVLPAGATPPNPQELIGRSAFAELLQSLAGEYDVVIVDTPAASEYPEAQVIATHASAALIVARKDRTSMPEAISLTRSLQQTGAIPVGSVLNDF